jgi:hypothetical protein
MVITALVFEDFTRLKSFSLGVDTMRELWLKMLMFTQVVKSFFKEVTSLILWGVSPLYTKMQMAA